jgi:hypothetical protein
MGNKGLYQLMRKPHVVQNHDKIILRGSQQIRAKDDSQRFGRHMIILFKICNPVKVSGNVLYRTTKDETCQDVRKLSARGQGWLEEEPAQRCGYQEGDLQDFLDLSSSNIQ